MIRAKLLYAVLLVILFFFWILYRGTLSFQLLLFGLLFPIPLWLMLFALRRALAVSLKHTQEPISTGTAFEWVLAIRNRSIFPAAYATVVLEYSTSLSSGVQKLRVQLPVLPRNTQRLLFRFHAAACGVQTLRVTRLRIYDPLHLFRRDVMSNVSDSVLVLPAADPQIGEDWALHQHISEDSDTYDPHKQGDDPSEIFDMHSYREGDSVSRINWKLSAKLDQLLVKEYSLPIAGQLLLLPDFRQAGNAQEAALRLDAMLGAMHNAASFLLERGIPFSMLRMTPRDGIVSTGTIDAAETVGEYFYALFSLEPAEDKAESVCISQIMEMLTDPMMHDHLLFFTPLLSDDAAASLASLPDPSHLTVFAVRDDESEKPMKALPFEWITVPVSPAPPAPEQQHPVTVLTEAEMYYDPDGGGGEQ